jgi:serine protease
MSVKKVLLCSAIVAALGTSAAAIAGGPQGSLAARANLGGLQSAEQHDSFIVKYRDGSAQRRSAVALNRSLSTAAAGVGRGKALGLQRVRSVATGAEVVRSNRKLDRVEAEALMRQIAADPNVEYVEVNIRMYPLLVPNDLRYGEQWGYSGTYGIKAEQAWDLGSGEGAVVAVIDTGIVSHSDLDANVLPGYDFISDAWTARDDDGRDADASDAGDGVGWFECGYSFPYLLPSNSSWHGSHVAGTVGAVTDNNNGVAGVAHGAKIVPVRVLGRCGGTLDDIADAIIWAAGGDVAGIPANPNPAEVINMSLGGASACEQTMQSAIDLAVSRGTTVVVAAGNSNNDASGNIPANCNNVITVGASGEDGVRSDWGGGQASSYGEVVAVAAPGTDILSTINDGTSTPANESYAAYSGTSMATPHVAGVVALLQAAAATPKTPAEIATILKETAAPFAGTPDQPIGAGIVDAHAALLAVIGDGGGNPTPPPPESQTYASTTRVDINDNATVESPIVVSGRSGNAPNNAVVDVDIRHTYRGDLKVDLVAPDGSVYNLHNRAGGSADDVIATYQNVDLSSEALNGTWKLRVNDNASQDTGYISGWAISF